MDGPCRREPQSFQYLSSTHSHPLVCGSLRPVVRKTVPLPPYPSRLLLIFIWGTFTIGVEQLDETESPEGTGRTQGRSDSPVGVSRRSAPSGVVTGTDNTWCRGGARTSVSSSRSNGSAGTPGTRTRRPRWTPTSRSRSVSCSSRSTPYPSGSLGRTTTS